MWIFIEPIIDLIADRLDEKHGDFYRFFIGRVIAGCGCLPTRHRSIWDAWPYGKAGSRPS